jgi:hypothetical protein
MKVIKEIITRGVTVLTILTYGWDVTAALTTSSIAGGGQPPPTTRNPNSITVAAAYSKLPPGAAVMPPPPRATTRTAPGLRHHLHLWCPPPSHFLNT